MFRVGMNLDNVIVEADDIYGDGVNVAARLEGMAEPRHRDAAAAARQALELNPEYNMGLWMLGAAQVFAGECDAGAKTAARAVHVDIRDPYVHFYSRTVAYGHLGAARYGEAIDWFQRADQLAPGVAPNLAGLAVSSWLEGDEDGARYAVQRLMEEEPPFRLGEAHPLPYKDAAMWARLVEPCAAPARPHDGARQEVGPAIPAEKRAKRLIYMVPRGGIEPPTRGFSVRCSTD